MKFSQSQILLNKVIVIKENNKPISYIRFNTVQINISSTAIQQALGF